MAEAPKLLTTFAQEIERLSGQRVHPRAWDLRPIGAKLLVVLDGTPEKYKGIVLSEETRSLHRAGGGWVIAVGPDVGKGSTPYPGGPLLDQPDDLLGRHIIFGAHVGQVLRFSLVDREFRGAVVLMADRDIWAIDENPEAAAAELRDEK